MQVMKQAHRIDTRPILRCVRNEMRQRTTARHQTAIKMKDPRPVPKISSDIPDYAKRDISSQTTEGTCVLHEDLVYGNTLDTNRERLMN